MIESAREPAVAMQLIEYLEQRLSAESNLFRAQLLREDIARLRKLDTLARSALDADGYRRAGRRLGWTALDARTGELGATLDRLLDAWRDALADADNPAHEARMLDAWQELTRLRLTTMVGCLSTPIPAPSD